MALIKIKPYRCRLEGTEFYYKPSIGYGNLNKRGKIYTTARNGVQELYSDFVLITVRAGSPAHKALISKDYNITDSYRKGYVTARVPKQHFIKEEV